MRFGRDLRSVVASSAMTGFAAVMGAAAPAVTPSSGPVVVLLLEAESAGPGKAGESGADWEVRELKGASGGKVLAGTAADHLRAARPILVTLPLPGAYRVWVRYHKPTPRTGGFYALFQDEFGEETAFHACDWFPRLNPETPYIPRRSVAGEQTGFIWESFEAGFERAHAGTLTIGGCMVGGGYQERAVDCVVVTNVPGLAVASLSPEALAAAAATVPLTVAVPPRGFVAARGFPMHSSFFAGVADPAAQFHAGLINCGSTFIDAARALQLGFNRDHGFSSAALGIARLHPAESYQDAADLATQYKSPEGRFVNADGTVGQSFSLCFPPLAEGLAARIEAAIGPHLGRDDIDAWRICGESGGSLDYSSYAQAAFRQWLAAKHGTVEVLNRRWGTDYKAFDEIVPPKSFEAGRAAWLEFRDFSGTVFAEAVGRQLPIIRRLDPKQRPCVGQTSNLDLLAPYFTSLRPIDYEQFIAVALAGERTVSWDTYCADDYLGCEIDLMASLAPGHHLAIQEWNTHAVDPGIAARTYWLQVAKGLRGVYAFMFQEGTYHDSYPKWALLSHDRTEKPKLAAFADAAHEVHRLEPLLMAAERVQAVKPVAMYYSRIDLSIEKPSQSLWGEGANSPHHVYEVLRGLGHQVRWITPKQVLAGELDQVAAVVMVGAEHVPVAAAEKLEAWVRAGGAVIADRWPGAWDEYGRPQSTLTPVFGVRAAARKTTGSKIAVQESSQGYGEVTEAAVERQEIYENVAEIYQQWDATHPVARALGDFMISGAGLQDVECFAGKVIGMAFGDRPGVVVNDYGRGKALYFALMMGTTYEGSATRFEWDSTHSGLAFGRILDAFLRYAGARPAATAALPPRVRAKLRVEAPLVTPDGNALIGITSLNDDRLGPFGLHVALPEAARNGNAFYFVAGGSRRLTPVKGIGDDRGLLFELPGLDTHGMVLALKQAGPLVSLDVDAAVRHREAAGLATVSAGEEFSVRATVHNPSPDALPAGRVALYAPPGWFQSAESLRVGAIKPWSSREVEFTVRAPAFKALRRLRPLVVKFEAGDRRSTPATELVWW